MSRNSGALPYDVSQPAAASKRGSLIELNARIAAKLGIEMVSQIILRTNYGTRHFNAGLEDGTVGILASPTAICAICNGGDGTAVIGSTGALQVIGITRANRIIPALVTRDPDNPPGTVRTVIGTNRESHDKNEATSK